MKGKRIICFVFTGFLILFSLLSCEDTLEWYVGLNKQPNFFDNKGYEDALNIMGILRPDSIFNLPASFVHVEKTGPSNNDTNQIEWFEVVDANVSVFSIEDDVPVTETVFDYDTNQVFPVAEYRAFGFVPVAGQTYQLVCSHTEYEQVTGTTIIPGKPFIQYTITGNSLQIDVACDSSAYMYQATLLIGDTIIYSDYVVPGENSSRIVINTFQPITEEGILKVFAFDKNLAAYFSSVTSSILNLNSFRAPFSTVDGGYGVFGSMNALEVKVLF